MCLYGYFIFKIICIAISLFITSCSKLNHNYHAKSEHHEILSDGVDSSRPLDPIHAQGDNVHPFVKPEPAWEQLIKKLGGSLEYYFQSGNLKPELSLHYAAWSGNRIVLKRLCEEHPEYVNKKIEKLGGITPLHLAVYKKQESCIDLLISHNASIDAFIEPYEIQPIHIAASRGYLSIIQTLLREGSSISMTDVEGKTPLHWSAINGHTSCIRALLRQGSDPNDQDNFNDTSLCLAFRYGHAQAIKLLVESGGNVSCIHCMDGSPDKLLRWSIINKHAHCIESILNRHSIPVDIHRKD
ncbi:ankyrin repeat domain-containing protein [Cardinium endosymbiont of Culicoides punctatus]|uniref:ankyrin repeat domain-containing protein n=1 Tax=Cardinium endosymbiont of Culicoides punctatus TaxID=2304601 RepID=UPI001404408E|nr:ankyrin repeat domain-containing protein [Cardinium endosymbiont of Culicoides punctatus]